MELDSGLLQAALVQAVGEGGTVANHVRVVVSRFNIAEVHVGKLGVAGALY